MPDSCLQDAEASVAADLAAIRALIQSYAGGFGTLNDTVRMYLRQWFVSQGGVKVVARRARRDPGGPAQSPPPAALPPGDGSVPVPPQPDSLEEIEADTLAELATFPIRSDSFPPSLTTSRTTSVSSMASIAKAGAPPPWTPAEPGHAAVLTETVV